MMKIFDLNACMVSTNYSKESYDDECRDSKRTNDVDDDFSFLSFSSFSFFLSRLQRSRIYTSLPMLTPHAYRYRARKHTHTRTHEKNAIFEKKQTAKNEPGRQVSFHQRGRFELAYEQEREREKGLGKICKDNHGQMVT